MIYYLKSSKFCFCILLFLLVLAQGTFFEVMWIGSSDLLQGHLLVTTSQGLSPLKLLNNEQISLVPSSWGWDRVRLLLVHPFPEDVALWGNSLMHESLRFFSPSHRTWALISVSPHPERSTNQNPKLPNWQLSWNKSNSRALLSFLSSCFT